MSLFRRAAAVLLAAAALSGGPAPAGTGPAPADARFARAVQLIEAGEIEQAYAILEKLAEEQPQRWGERCRRRMEEIRELAAGQDRVRAEAARLREAAADAGGETAVWMRLEAARALYVSRLYAEALPDAEAAGEKEGRLAAPARLLGARCLARLGRSPEAVKAYRLTLAAKGAGRADRGAAWQECADLLAAGGKREDLCALLEEQVARGPEEPGAREAVERLAAVLLVDETGASRAGKLIDVLSKAWPAGDLSHEWVLTGAKIAEYIDRDWDRAERLYRLVLERFPEACFDLPMLRAGRPGADAGREVILAAVARVEKKRRTKFEPLKAPAAKDRGKSPENALAAVLCALRAGKPEAAGECATGEFAEELRARQYPFRDYALTEYRVLEAAETGGTAEVRYEVEGELGVTRVLEKKATAVREDGVWKISALGM